MTPSQLVRARAKLGAKWGLGRPLHAAELGRLLSLQGRDPGRSVLDWEAGRTAMRGPVEIALWYMLRDDDKPPTFAEAIKER